MNSTIAPPTKINKRNRKRKIQKRQAQIQEITPLLFFIILYSKKNNKKGKPVHGSLVQARTQEQEQKGAFH